MTVYINTEPGSSILQVQSTDLNSENIGDIKYSIISRAEGYYGFYWTGRTSQGLSGSQSV